MTEYDWYYVQDLATSYRQYKLMGDLYKITEDSANQNNKRETIYAEYYDFYLSINFDEARRGL